MSKLRTICAVRWLVVGIFLSYLAGFFLLAPLIYNSGEVFAYKLHKIDLVVYQRPIFTLKSSNPIRVLWETNASYWCDVSSRCEVNLSEQKVE